MIQFEWIWLFAALPLPLIYRWLLPARRESREMALLVPSLDDFGPLEETGAAPSTQRWL